MRRTHGFTYRRAAHTRPYIHKTHGTHTALHTQTCSAHTALQTQTHGAHTALHTQTCSAHTALHTHTHGAHTALHKRTAHTQPYIHKHTGTHSLKYTDVRRTHGLTYTHARHTRGLTYTNARRTHGLTYRHTGTHSLTCTDVQGPETKDTKRAYAALNAKRSTWSDTHLQGHTRIYIST